MKKSISNRQFIIGLSILLFTPFILVSAQKFEAVHLRAGYKVNPIGIGTVNPALSWEIISRERNCMQTAYQIRAAFTEKELVTGKNLIWDTGKINSEASNQIQYKGGQIGSGQRIYWQVRVWNNLGKNSGWSPPAWFETGLLQAADWKANWIEPAWEEDPAASNPCPMFRKEFKLKGSLKEARIYISSHGLYELRMNGEKVGDELFTPGWTSYHKRIQYQVYDVTSRLRPGDNALGVILGDGWYRGFLVWEKNRNLYGKNLGLIVQLKLTYTDGTEEFILSDETWKASTGPVLQSDIYNGETYNASLEKDGWCKTGYNDRDWKQVKTAGWDKKVLAADDGAPVRITQSVKPVAEITTPRGERVFDMGQNMVGWIQFQLKGKKGDKITLKFAEILDKEGNFYTDNLRSAKATDQYYFKGEGVETYEPRFTFHGFRYVKIEDYTGEIRMEDLTGKVIHSDMGFTGQFSCSDSLVNQLQQNIQWGLRGNFLDVPTDCPQRDERLGWTGDAQVFAPTACFNTDAVTFFTKWLKDLSADQHEDGAVPDVVPDVLKNNGGATGWADAAVVIPWVVYQTFNDRSILENQYSSMKAWVEYMRKKAGTTYLFNTGWHYGDWLAFSTNWSDYPGATTDKDLIATAYFAHSVRLLQQTAEVLNHTSDAADYADLFQQIQSAFQKEFMTPNGRLSSNTQTAYTLALCFDLIPENLKKEAAARLAQDVRKMGHLTTGFLGTPLICDALSENGYTDLAYMLIFRKEYPSWLYPVTQGATTIWERWDGQKPDGSFQDVGMNSFNHYAYGAVGNWIYRNVAGIQMEPGTTGYKKFIISPLLTPELSFAKASYHSVYGKIVSEWKKTDQDFILKISIPANTTAQIRIPVPPEEETTNNTISPPQKKQIKISRSKEKVIVDLVASEYKGEDINVKAIIGGKAIIEVGSGEYEFFVKQ